MQQKATVPVIVLGVLAVLLLVWFLGKSVLGPSPTNPDKPKLPSFIDPATGRPYEGVHGGSGQSQSGTHLPASTPGGGAPGGQ